MSNTGHCKRDPSKLIKIARNSMLRTPLTSPVFTRMSVKKKSSSKSIDTLEKSIQRIRSHCLYTEGREQKAYYKVLEELKKERRDLEDQCTKKK